MMMTMMMCHVSTKFYFFALRFTLWHSEIWLNLLHSSTLISRAGDEILTSLSIHTPPSSYCTFALSFFACCSPLSPSTQSKRHQNIKHQNRKRRTSKISPLKHFYFNIRSRHRIHVLFGWRQSDVSWIKKNPSLQKLRSCSSSYPILFPLIPHPHNRQTWQHKSCSTKSQSNQFWG